MTITKRTTYYIDDFAVEHEPTGEPIIRKLDDGRTVVGYLCYEECAENPLSECDGVGAFIDWRYNKHEFVEGVATLQQRGHVHLFVKCDVYSHSGEKWSVSGEGMRCQWDTARGAGVWYPDPYALEHIRYEADRRVINDWTPEGSCVVKAEWMTGGKYALTMPDGSKRGSYKSPSSAIRAAAKLLGIKIFPGTRRSKQREVAVECCRNYLETYNNWLAGENYGVCVEVFGADGEKISDDACWGYTGKEYARQTLEEEVGAYK